MKNTPMDDLVARMSGVSLDDEVVRLRRCLLRMYRRARRAERRVRQLETLLRHGHHTPDAVVPEVLTF